MSRASRVAALMRAWQKSLREADRFWDRIVEEIAASRRAGDLPAVIARDLGLPRSLVREALRAGGERGLLEPRPVERCPCGLIHDLCELGARVAARRRAVA